MENKRKFLLHVCCAPCLSSALATLRAPDSSLFREPAEVFFFNPNIHPLLEFRRRVKALCLYLERDPVPAEIDDRYGLHDYLAFVCEGASTPPPPRERCRRCYRFRLGRAAARTAARGLAAFTTTLLASREQDRGLVAEVGREAAESAGVEFLECDLRRIVADEKALRGIYKQQYCGCIFSEEERYRNTAKHLYGSGRNEE